LAYSVGQERSLVERVEADAIVLRQGEIALLTAEPEPFGVFCVLRKFVVMNDDRGASGPERVGDIEPP
jgi:hypothetical protein